MSLENYGKMTDERLAEIFKASIKVSGFYAKTEEEEWQGILRSFANRVLMEFTDHGDVKAKEAMSIHFPWQKRQDPLLGDYWVGTDPLYAPLKITGKQLYEKWWSVYGLTPYYAFDSLEKKIQTAWNELGSS